MTRFLPLDTSLVVVSEAKWFLLFPSISKIVLEFISLPLCELLAGGKRGVERKKNCFKGDGEVYLVSLRNGTHPFYALIASDRKGTRETGSGSETEQKKRPLAQ